MPEPQEPTGKETTLHQAWTERGTREKPPTRCVSAPDESCLCLSLSDQTKTSRVRSRRKGKQSDRNTEVGRELWRSPCPTRPAQSRVNWVFPLNDQLGETRIPNGMKIKVQIRQAGAHPAPSEHHRQGGSGSSRNLPRARADFGLRQLSCVLVKFLAFLSSQV